jgi:uncharacterized membrane protein
MERITPTLRSRLTLITMVLVWAVIVADLAHVTPVILDGLIVCAAVLLLLTAVDAITRWSRQKSADRR